MKKILLILCSIFTFVTIAACSSPEETNGEEELLVEIEIEQVLQEEELDKEHEHEETAKSSVPEKLETGKENKQNEKNEGLVETETKYFSYEDIKKKELIGLSTFAVKELFGEANVVSKDSIVHGWRFDFSKEGYQYNENQLAIDIQGLTTGEMHAQLMVFFEEDIVTNYYILYFNGEEVMQYWVKKDGTEEFPAHAD